MSAQRPAKELENEKCLNTVVESAKKISRALKNREQLNASHKDELERLIKRSFPLRSSTGLSHDLSSLDTLGCDLWNGATNIVRDAEQERGQLFPNGDEAHIVALLRVFAYFLLDTAHPATAKRSRDEAQRNRNFKTAIKACRFCLNNAQVELALKVLERCAEYVRTAEENQPLVNLSDTYRAEEDALLLRNLTAEYYLLRLMHSWKADQLDALEHFYGQIPANLQHSSELAEKAAELFHEIGRGLSKRNFSDAPIKWLRRALERLDAFDLEYVDHDASDLRLAISASLVDALISGGKSEYVEHAQILVDQLFTTHGLGNRVAVQLLRLKVLLAEQPADQDRIRQVMIGVLQSAVLTPINFKIIVQAIHRVRRVDNVIACYIIGRLIRERLLPDLTAEREGDHSMYENIERACVTYILFVADDTETARNTALAELCNTLDAVVQRDKYGFSAQATHAAQALIWKAAGDSQSEASSGWCELLQHRLFDGAGQVNKVKIGRKAMKAALAKSDTNGAREAFFQLPSSGQNESLTRYLAFKLALQANDYDLATESLNTIVKNADHDHTFLYACVLEAQQSDMRRIAVVALQAILDKQLPNINLPTLLRCIARILIGELDGKDRRPEEVMDELVGVFETVAMNTKALRQGGGDQYRAEIQWWSKNAYNMSLQRCADMHPEHLVRLLRTCTQLIDCLPNDTGIMHHDDMWKRKALCHFLSTTALVVLGRSNEQGSENRLQCYLQARQEIQAFWSTRQKLAKDVPDEIQHKTFELLKFDLECILQLQQWDQFDAILKACLDLAVVDRWDTLADVVLIIHQKSGVGGLDEQAHARMAELLERIINDTWRKDRDLTKAFRWLRLAYSMDLADGTGDFALKLLEQAAGMAKRGYEKGDDSVPDRELQWVSTTAFNRAVDLLSSGQRSESAIWIDGALELARYAADNGGLHANLTDKREQAMKRAKESTK